MNCTSIATNLRNKYTSVRNYKFNKSENVFNKISIFSIRYLQKGKIVAYLVPGFAYYIMGFHFDSLIIGNFGSNLL